MKISVLDKSTLGEDLDISPLYAYGETVIYDKTSPEEVASHIGDADAVFVNKVKLNRTNLLNATNLKIICEAATGYDNIDLDYCKEAGIAVCNVPAYSANSVSQVTVAMVMSLATHIPEYNRCVSSGDYTKSGIPNKLTPVFHELCGKKWGIIGYGNIGKKVGDVARALGCEIMVYKRTPEDGVNCVDIDTLLRESDIISVHLPHTPETDKIIDERRISLMKKDTIFVNVARGKVCDEEALCRAVLENKIRAIGVDVYSTEPFGEDSPYNLIMDRDNVCLTPHMAWGAYEARLRCFNIMLENLTSFIKGEEKNRIV